MGMAHSELQKETPVDWSGPLVPPYPFYGQPLDQVLIRLAIKGIKGQPDPLSGGLFEAVNENGLMAPFGSALHFLYHPSHPSRTLCTCLSLPKNLHFFVFPTLFLKVMQ